MRLTAAKMTARLSRAALPPLLALVAMLAASGVLSQPDVWVAVGAWLAAHWGAVLWMTCGWIGAVTAAEAYRRMRPMNGEPVASLHGYSKGSRCAVRAAHGRSMWSSSTRARAAASQTRVQPPTELVCMRSLLRAMGRGVLLAAYWMVLLVLIVLAYGYGVL